MQSSEAPLHIETARVDSLIFDPANARSIDEHTLDALGRSVHEFGFVQPVIARRADRVVIAGHQRLKAARREGLETVPVIFLDISPERGRALGLALNKITGTWDEGLLARLLAELDAVPGIDLAVTGFDEDEIRALLKSLEVAEKRDRIETFDLDRAVAAATNASRSQRGDLWRLGDHRLLHGDATDSGDIARVLDGGRAAMTFTDPPYNVDYTGAKQPHDRQRCHDARRLADVRRGFGANILRSTDGAIYVCMSSKEWPTVSAILAEAGGHWSTRSSGPRTASSSAAPTTSAAMSRSGTAGARAPATTGAATATSPTSGPSTAPMPRPCTPR